MSRTAGLVLFLPFLSLALSTPTAATCLLKGRAFTFDPATARAWSCTSREACPRDEYIGTSGWRNWGRHLLIGQAYDTHLTTAGKSGHARLRNWWDLAGPHGLLAGAKPSIVILGEVHDNVDHHELRSNFVGCMERPVHAVVLEQLKSDQKFARDGPSRHPSTTIDDFKSAINWEASGWAKYDYDSVFRALVETQAPVYAGDVPRADIMKAAKEGPAALTAEDRARLALDIPLGEKLDAASLAEIEEAHCSALPKEMLPNMAFAQRYRDAHLADATLKAAEKHGSAVLFAGNGHARTDRGVPWYIRQRAPDRKVVSVLLIEVEEGKTDPEAYVPRDPDGKPAADYIIFTPRAERPDPCAQLIDKKH